MNFVIHANTLIANDEGKILLVREKKEKNLNKLNFPGGHLELGEKLVAGAVREAIEEVGVEIEVTGLLGIFTGYGADHYISFVFAGKIKNGAPVANMSEVNAAGWYSVDEVLRISDSELVNAKRIKKCITMFQSRKAVPLDIIEELF